MRRLLVSLAAALLGASAPALDVVFDKRTPKNLREWADRGFLRENMEAAAADICKALYGGESRSKLHENFTIILNLSPKKGGNPAFAAGRRITWKVGENPKPLHGGCPGILVHEMTHVLDMASDRVFTEAMADWVRYYRVSDTPPGVLDRRHKALRGSRHYGKYAAGANFMDFMTQNFGEGTVYRILKGYAKHKGKVWERLFGKNIDGLVAEWRRMETIYDPVWQWSYNGTGGGKVRHDKKACKKPAMRGAQAAGRSGLWLAGAAAGKLEKRGGDITLALHGRFPKMRGTAIASLGSAKAGAGKALLLAAGRPGFLEAHVIAAVPGKGCGIVSTTPVRIPGSASAPHSAILTVKGGDAAVVMVDGVAAVKIDMKAKCEGCQFTPVFAIGGVSGGFGVAGFAEPGNSGGGSLLVDDVRVFDRVFRKREVKQYATVFDAGFRPAVPVGAVWCGGGNARFDDPAAWRCWNSAGERVAGLPAKETAVKVRGRNLPSIPQGAKFACKSFTIDGLAVVDDRDVDLRGVKTVDISDNARIITRNGRVVRIGSLRANRVRLDGTLSVSREMKASGNFELREGAVLRLPPPDMAQVKSFSIQGKGTATLKPARTPVCGSFTKIACVKDIPKDLSRFRLDPDGNAGDAVFQRSPDGRYLCAILKKR